MSTRSTRRHVNRAIVNYESESDSVQTNAPGSSGGTRKVASNNSADIMCCTNETDLQILISNCIRHILLNDYSKLLIKQSDINKYLIENVILGRIQINPLIKMLNQRLWKDFGMILIEVECSPKSFILYTIYKNDLFALKEMNNDDDEIEFDTNLVPDDYDDEITPNYEDDSNFDHLTYDEVFDKSKNTLILFILSFILIEDEEKISESELFSALEEIGLYLDYKYEIAHDCARQNIRELISKEFIRKSYLKRTKKPNSDTSLPADYYYEWGIRSTFEFKRLDVLNFIKDIYNCDEVHMNLLFEKAKKMDQQREKLITNAIRSVDHNYPIDNNQISNDLNGHIEISVNENITQPRRSQRHSQIETQSTSSSTNYRKQQKRVAEISSISETTTSSLPLPSPPPSKRLATRRSTRSTRK